MNATYTSPTAGYTSTTILKQKIDTLEKVVASQSTQLQGVLKPDVFRKPFLLAAIGDSRFANSLNVQSNGTNWSNRGILSWAMFLTEQKYNLPSNYDKAVSGYTSTQILGLVPSVLALNPKPKYCIVLGGTNDNPMNLSLLKSNFQAIASQLVAGEIVPIFFTDLPRANTSWSTTSKQVDLAFNNWLRGWCRDNGYLLVDPYATMINQNDGQPSTGTLIDGIHHSCLGSYLAGKKLADVLNSSMPLSWDSRMDSIEDIYDATNNPYGNLLGTIGLLQGTGGSNLGTGASGTVATGWTNRVVTGTGTCVASKENPRADGYMGDAQVLAINATTLLNTRFYPATYPTGWNVGDTVIAEMDLEVAAGSVGLDYFHLYLQATDGTTDLLHSIAFKGDTAAAYPLPNVAFKGRMRSIPFVIPSGTTSLRPWIEGQIEAGGSATVKIGNIVIRKVYPGDGSVY